MHKLSLCIIVGNETEELERLLKSVQGPLFDEIIVTTTQDSPETKKIAEKYADKSPHFNWIKDFSAARNFCYDQATGTHIMWLDADDVLKPDQYNKLFSRKEELFKYDSIIMTYNYGHTPEGGPSVQLPRERITRNIPTYRWIDPIHEYLPQLLNASNQKWLDIEVDHYREKPYDPERNIEILRKVYNSGNASPRNKFYFGKDLMDSGNEDYKKEAVGVLEKYLKGPHDFVQNKAVSCIKLAEYFQSKKDFSTSNSYLRRGINFCNKYAELYVYLGDYYFSNKEFGEAVSYYREAMTKSPKDLFGARVYFYHQYPLNKIIQSLFYLNKIREGLTAVDEYLSVYPEDINHQNNKKLFEKLLREGVAPSNFCKEDIKLLWMIPFINPTDPSQRIRRLNMHIALKDKGVDTELFTNYDAVDPQWLKDKVSDRNAIIFSSFREIDLNLMKILRQEGKKVFVDLNEDILDNNLVRQCLKEADAVFCCSTVLLEKAKPFCRVLAKIEDPVEPADKDYDYFTEVSKPKALYIGMGGNSFLASEYLKDTIEEAGYELVLCTEWDNADVKWDLETWQETMRDAQVVLCPQRVDVQPAKSNIKAAQAMELGVPVIASNLPSYVEFVENGKNGYLCENKEDWLASLIQLKDLKKRIQIGMNGRDTAQQFSLKNMADKWIHLLKSAMTSTSIETKQVAVEDSVKETVPIVIPVYNEVEYLKACLSSIHMNTLYPYHIILSDAGSDEETWEYLNSLKGITVIGDPSTRKTFSQAVNDGVSIIGDPRFFTVLNSDVLVSKGWLTNLVKKMETTDRLGACGVLSNCDRGWLHGVQGRPSFNMSLEDGTELVPGMKYNQIIPRLDSLNNFMYKSNQELSGKYVDQAWVAYYATIFAKSAWDDVGYLDPIYKNGCEDLDHARRLSSHGYRIGQALDSFVFHFGGISRGCYQTENKEEYDKEDQYNHYTYAKKWEKKEIIIYTGPAWEEWDREKVDEGMAGSETWAADLAAEFSKMGYLATIFGVPPQDREGKPDKDGVVYRDYRTMKDYLEYRYIHMVILSRTCEPPKTLKMHTSNLYVMVHDIWLHQDKSYDTMQWAVKKFGVLSEWHDEFFRNHHSIPSNKTMMTYNGVRQERYTGVDASKKKNKMVYSSSPDRGLEALLMMLPKIREEVPDFEVDVTYGFHNWESMAKQRGDQNSLNRIDNLKKAMEQPGVNYLGRVNKDELARLQKESKIWAFPTWFSETFCCLPSNEILTKEGYKPFSELTIEDKVLTHKNRYRKIEQIMSRDYKGEVLGLSLKGTKPVRSWFTPEHPILSMSAEQVRKIKGHAYGDYKDEVLEACPEWRHVSDLREGDYVCFPKEKGNPLPRTTYSFLEELKKIHRGYKSYGGRVKQKNRADVKGVPVEVPMDKDFARFLGLYFAEGSFSQSTVVFAFNVKEREYIDFVKKYAKDSLGLDSSEYIQGNCISIKIYSFPLGRVLSSLVGSGSHKKEVPSIILNSSDEVKKFFLKGAFGGDGNIQDKYEVRISLASKRGIMGIRNLFFSLDIYPTYRISVTKGEEYYTLGISQSQWAPFFGKESYKGSKESKIWFKHKGYVFYPIKEIKEKKYEGRVYNLEVEEDNSYVSDFIAVHNCITGVENGLAGNSIVTTPYAGLLTTLGDSASYIRGPQEKDITQWWMDPQYQADFIKETVKLLRDEEYRLSLADKVYDKVKGYTWENAALQWLKESGV